MKRATPSIRGCATLLSAGLLAMALTACDITPAKTETPKIETPSTALPVKAPVAALPTIRVKAGADADFKDAKGVVWKADSGFEGGSTIDRTGQITITGTDTPDIYMAEHYQMDSWSTKVPNGSYTVKLHFSEDYDGITSATDRVFTYAVIDGGATGGKTIKEVKDFSPWKSAGAQYKAYVDSVPVTVTSGQITVKFTAQVENPQINAIEVIPK